MDRHPYTFGVDVGGTKILGVVAGPDGQVLDRLQVATPKVADAVPDGILAVVAQLMTRFERPEAVGVGVPGLVDHAGVLHYGPNVPGVVGLDIAGHLERRFGLLSVAENDASCHAVAEHRLGVARGHDHVVIVNQGTGIGGALILNGELYRGANGFAGEPGHQLIDPAGPMCACSHQGCWEAVASGAGLANLARLVVAEGRGGRIVALAGGDAGHIRGEHVAAALNEGDPDATEVIERFAWWVGHGLANLIALLDPDLIVLGGGLAAISDRFIPQVRQLVAEQVMGGPYRPEVPIVAAQLGPEAGAVGAALVAWDAVAAGRGTVG